MLTDTRYGISYGLYKSGYIRHIDNHGFMNSQRMWQLNRTKWQPFQRINGTLDKMIVRIMASANEQFDILKKHVKKLRN